MPNFKNLAIAGGALEEELALVAALRDLAKAWRAKAGSVADLQSLEDLLDLVAADANSATVQAAFAALGAQPLRAKVAAALAKVAGIPDQIPDKYKLLLRKLGSFDESADAKDVGLVRWAVTKDKAIPLAKDLSLGLEASGRIELEAGDTWRFSGDDMPDPLLRVGAGGRLGAKADAKLPFRLGAAKAGASASGALGLDYYFSPSDPDELFVSVVASRLSELPDPFDYEAVWDAFATTDIAGIVYELEGRAAAQLEVSLADTLSLGTGALATVGVGVKAGVSLSGGYILSFRRGAPAAGGRQIIATLSRQTASSLSGGVSVGVDVDISALAARVHAVLQNALGKWDAILADVRPFLSPGTWLQGKASDLIGQAATDIIGNAALKDAIVRDLRGAIGVDTTNQSAVVGWVEQALAGALERSGLLAAAEGQADRLVDALAGQLPAFAEAQFRTALTDAVKKLPPKIEAAFKDQVKALLGPAGVNAQALGDALEAAGVKAKGAVAALDKALEGVRALVERYDTLFRKIVAEADDAARRKISARIQIEEIRDKSSTYQVVGAFTSRDAAGARRAFHALTHGDLDGLRPLFDGAPGDGFDIVRERSSIRRFAKSEGKFGYEVVLLGFGVTGGTLLSGEASAMADGAGNIQVDTKGQLVKNFTGPREGREVSFVDTYGLRLFKALAGEPPTVRRSLELGVSITHNDESLKRREVVGFIQSLETAGLVPPGTRERGEATFNQWKLVGGDTWVKADIAAKLWLTDKSPLALMCLGERQAGQLAPGARRRIVSEGLEALLDARAVDADELTEATDLVRPYLKMNPKPEELPDVFLAYPDKWPKIEVQWPSWSAKKSKEIFEFFKTQHERVADLVELIDLMGDVYEATPVNIVNPAASPPGAWDEEAYSKVQRKIAANSRRWLKLNQKFLFWAGSDVHPRTVAFLTAMARLSGVSAQNPMTLTMTHRPKDGPPVTVALA